MARHVPSQAWAHAKVGKAIKAGLLVNLRNVRVKCVDCRWRRASMYDHREYRRPLDVQPVCRRCNIKRGHAIDAYQVKGIRLLFCLPPQLHEQLRFAAARENCPRTRIIIAALEKYFNGEKAVQ